MSSIFPHSPAKVSAMEWSPWGTIPHCHGADSSTVSRSGCTHPLACRSQSVCTWRGFRWPWPPAACSSPVSTRRWCLVRTFPNIPHFVPSLLSERRAKKKKGKRKRRGKNKKTQWEIALIWKVRRFSPWCTKLLTCHPWELWRESLPGRRQSSGCFCNCNLSLEANR